VDGWGGYVVKEKLKLIKISLKDWHMTHTKNLPARIQALKSQIDMLDSKGEENVLSEEEVDELHSMSTELQSLSRANASITWQQSRLLWLREGDANSKYFHATMSGRSRRSRRNAISSIIVGNNHVEGVSNVREAVFTHFKNNFQAQDVIRPRVDTLQFRRLSVAESVHYLSV
jgi:hypothetical protein